MWNYGRVLLVGTVGMCCLLTLTQSFRLEASDVETLEGDLAACKFYYEENSQEQNAALSADISGDLADENDGDEFCDWRRCDEDLSEPRGLSKIFDFGYLKKLARNLNPFAKARHQMRFFLFRSSFPECGRELLADGDDDDALRAAGLDPSLPTRIIIHGWMSQSRGSFNRDVKNAYLSRGDFNIIVTDWSASASNPNYFAVVKLVEEFGAQLALFTDRLHSTLGVSYDDIYLIGHSLGAQIAGAAGKRLQPPAQYNTIYALDPAGPRFRQRSPACRIDPTDAKYVESIQTSGNLGFQEPTGNATFYPNYGKYQKNCYYVGCSHIRSYKMFAESLTSQLGFWGTPCERNNSRWDCREAERERYRMGGEPALRKHGLFYVDTGKSSPFALGRKLGLL